MPNDKFRNPHQPASEGKFSVQGPVCEEGGNFGRLQNSGGPASKGESAVPLGWGPGWELSLGGRREEHLPFGVPAVCGLQLQACGEGLVVLA